MRAVAGPVVLHASQTQFAPAGRMFFPRVESRMVLLCRGGSGTVDVNGTTYPLRHGAALVLPWGHAIGYAASDGDPFLVGGAHLVARHATDTPIDQVVPHEPQHPLTGCPWRSDDPTLPPDTGVLTTSAADHPSLVDLAVYAIGLFSRGRPSDDTVRALGALLTEELRTMDQPGPGGGPGGGPAGAADLPTELRRVTTYVGNHLGQGLTLRSLAAVAGCSQATLARKFRRHLRATPMEWVTSRRMAYATQLLRTTSLPVNQVARRCGFVDPFYFSRLFRDRHGASPRAWRSVQHLV